MSDEEPETDTRRVLDVLQSMIDISADRLEGLRTQCATSAELTQQEIRTLEGKLIKLFTKQLVSRAKLRETHRPSDTRNSTYSLRQWLQVVGLSPQSVVGVCGKVNSLESLRDKSEHEIRVLLNDAGAREEEIRRLSRALRNLRRYTDVLLHGEKSSPIGEPLDVSLCWDSWDRQVKVTSNYDNRTSPRPPRSRVARRSVPSSEEAGLSSGMGSGTLSSSALHQHSNTNTPTHHTYQGPLSPPPILQSHSTPPSTPTLVKGKGTDKGKFPTTPPPRKKHQTNLPANSSTALIPDTLNPLTKSRSHESQLSNKVDNGNTDAGGNSSEQATRARRGRLPTEPGPTVDFSLLGSTSPQLSSPVRSPPYSSGPSGSDCSDDNAFRPTLQVPKSPRTPTVARGMGHYIEHRFKNTFKMMTTCDYCDKQMFIGTGLKCKECKFKCHKDCESKVPPSCGLPPELVHEFAKTLESDGFQSPNLPSRGVAPSPSHRGPLLVGGSRSRKKVPHIGNMGSQQLPSTSNIAPYPGPDSSSNTSSCNSSTPSSPALLGNAPHTPLTLVKAPQQFHFPDVTRSEYGVTLETHPLSPPVSNLISSQQHIMSPPPASTSGPLPSPAARARIIGDLAESQRSNDSDRTIISVGTSGSGSTDSERTPVRVDSVDSQVSDGESGIDKSSAWPRQNSLSLREWDIPYDELKIGEPIGTGRFGTVYRGNWHGAVAIKVLNMDHLDDEKTLEAFRSEVATFRKTRHENLVLFMGACMKLPRLAIVTSLCKGLTLYTHIHLRKDKFNMNRTTLVAQQISQGMGYLHARGIVHKDLKTKNIFLENGKVVITDFGLFSVARLCYGHRKCNGLNIPPGWLCYLAPEIIRSLRSSSKNEDEDLKFTKYSDIYAFGTVWYELLCGEWPFKGQPPEAIIWQVGKGMKQSLANLQASRDVKDILMTCWSYKGCDRPDFAELLKTLEKLPKKRLARSPSHPVHLSRSAESVF